MFKCSVTDESSCVSTVGLSLPKKGNIGDDEYTSWIKRINERFDILVKDNVPLFITNVDNLFRIFLSMIDGRHRQYHNCHACRMFVNCYGKLVCIDPKHHGVFSPIWSVEDAPFFYRPAVQAMLDVLKHSKITGVFYSSEGVWGTPVIGEWTHFAIERPPVLALCEDICAVKQCQAMVRENFAIVQRAFLQFDINVVQKTLNMLKSGMLYRGEKVIEQAEWLYRLRFAYEQKGSRKSNVIWLAVATAPVGFCHVGSSALGTLFSDVANDLPSNIIKQRFSTVMDALSYMRPKAKPTAQNVRQAEKIVEDLGIVSSLKRRFARIEDINALWTYGPGKSMCKSGVFGHILTKDSPITKIDDKTYVSTTRITWEKFARTVLPEAMKIEYYVPDRLNNYVALVTASDPSAPPIIQWDSKEKRNPVSWYVWHNGSLPSQWGLSAGTYHNVFAVTLKPSMWNDDRHYRHGKGVIFILEGAKETRPDTGLALFPEFLMSRLHSIRSMIESFSRSGRLEGADGPMACGVMLSGDAWNQKFCVTTKSGMLSFVIDRWD